MNAIQNHFAVSRIMLDIRFAEDSGEFGTSAPLLRYVAALNPDATRQQFVDAAESCGYKRNTAANRFRESRKFDEENAA